LSQKGGEVSKLEKFKKTLTGKWEAVVGGGDQKIFIEFHADGTSLGYSFVNGQRRELRGRWEALREDGDRVIVKSTVDGTSVELPYWFVSDDEYRYITPQGQTIAARRSK
jgi:hypothetical protein